MDIIPDKKKLIGLVEQAYDGRLCLPNFQRDFVWPTEDVADLLRSVLRQYFIGSILLLRSDRMNPPFDPQFLRDAKPIEAEPHPELLVLDGQQRLTSLLYALTAPNSPLKDSSKPRRFFVDLGQLLEDADSDSVVFDRRETEVGDLGTTEGQFKAKVLPAASLLHPKDFLSWRDGYDDWLRERSPEEHALFRSEWRDIWTRAVTDFQNFQVPAIELPQASDKDPEMMGRVCAIFEKLNSHGVELTVYDLLTAKLYRSNIRLHDMWALACQKNPRLRSWSRGKADHEKFGVLILRTLTLLRDLDPKPKALINLNPEGFQRDWERACESMEKALSQVENTSQDGFGVFDEKWLPGYSLLPPLAALRAVIDEHRLGANARQDLRRWYWSNVFLERYSSAVESKSRRDYSDFTQYWLHGGPTPAVFVEAEQRIGSTAFSIRDSTSKSSSTYSGVFSLLAIGNARDWRREENIQLQTLQDHHIFPRNYLKGKGITKRDAVNTIANRTLISNETNNKIKDEAPAGYMSNRALFAEGLSLDLLAAHFIDGVAAGLMEQATREAGNDVLSRTYTAFLDERERVIVDRIRDVCGVTPGG